MDNKSTIEMLLNQSTGIVTTEQVTKAGLHRSVLAQLVEQEQLYRVNRGVYMKSESWEDEMFLLQHRYRKGIFSHETALYLHSMTDRTPMTFSMTFPKGYNTPSIKKENVVVYRVVPENYELGIMELSSPSGNPLRVYDLERTLCDIVRGNNTCDIQIVNQAMKQYAISKDKDISKLLSYAEQLRVKPKILNYMEVLL
jgi:Predicted transcriptional regulator